MPLAAALSSSIVRRVGVPVGVGTGAAVVSVMVAIAKTKMVIKDVNRVIFDI